MSRSCFRVRLLALAACAALAGRAQTYDQVAPKTPPVAPVALPAPALPAAGDDDRVLVPALSGLSFLADKSAFRSEGVSTPGLHVSGEVLLETGEFTALVTPYLGRPLTQRLLNQLTRDVVLYFRQHGRPVVDVLVPEQNISSGNVQILVVEGHLGQVRVEGSKWFTDAQISAAVRAPRGEIIEGAPLLEDMTWINRNPFRQTDLVFMRGEQPGETDVVLRTRDRYPLRVYLGYEDSGNALTGYDRVLAGVNWGNAFGLDQQLNYQLTASPDFKKLVAHSGSYIIPIPSLRDTLTFFGSYAESQPELEGGFFDLTGRSWQVSARYQVPLVARGGWTSEFTGGVDFKRSNNNLSFGGTQVFAEETDVVQAILALSTRHADKRGTTTAELTVALSPGGLTDGNHTAPYQIARAGARPDYAYALLEIERVTNLPHGWSWLVRGTGQLASTNLLGSEELGLGGARSLRGYEDREANGDDGLVLVNELHGPLLRVIADGRLDPLVFFDCGVVASHDPLPAEPSHLDLASAGVGLRYNLGGHFSLRADYGWQLKDSGVSDGRRDSRGHISVVLSY
ncbi:MAG: ShlB/FhaC/HecB family hemolysin secretion/activation protein [Lacunisphaera sp.]